MKRILSILLVFISALNFIPVNMSVSYADDENNNLQGERNLVNLLNEYLDNALKIKITDNEAYIDKQDPWGTNYRFEINLENDYIQIYSAGKDKDYNTVEDNYYLLTMIDNQGLPVTQTHGFDDNIGGWYNT